MKKNLRKKFAAVALTAGVALGGCKVGASEASEVGAASNSTASNSSAGSANSAATGGAGLKTLDSLRNASEKSVPSGDVYSTTVTAAKATVESVMAENQKPHADSNDAQYDAASATKISLNGASASVEGSGAAASEGKVTISSAGTYVLSGKFTGQILVAAADSDKVKIVLDGAEISSSTDAAIRVKSADEAVVVAAEGTVNSVSDTSKYADSSGPTAAIASSADLTLGGAETLNVTGNGNDGVSSSDGLVILGGKINVKAADDAVRGQDYVVIAGGTLSLQAKGDAVKADNETASGRGYVLMTGGNVTASAGSDAIDATSDVILAGGSTKVAKSQEGVEGAAILLAGGSAAITSSDDGLNATGGDSPWLSVTGGDWTVNAQGDGFDSNGAGYMSGGKMTVWGPTNGGNGAVDAESGLTMAGGTLFAAGSQGMDQAPATSSAQASIKVAGQASKGSTFAVFDSNGKQIASYTLAKNAGSFVFSSPDIVKGKKYTIKVDGEQVVTATAGDYDENRMSMPGGGR